jgi:phosphate transport system protein
MSKHLVRDLEGLQRQILGMAGYVEEMIFRSTQALREHDKLLALEVIASDNKVDALDNAITEECLKLVALHQPVAKDLRRIATVFMITTDLERMGDLACDIAQRAVAMSDNKISIPDKLPRMTDLATAMVRQSLDAFVNLDGKQAKRVIRLDDEVDRLNAEIIDELIVRMKASSETIEPNISLFSAVRHLERIADHATNIAEDVLYMVDGEIVRHRHQQIEDD